MELWIAIILKTFVLFMCVTETLVCYTEFLITVVVV